MTAALELTGVSVERGGRHVLETVTLAAAPGEVLGLVGPNGAGRRRP
jgi:iron complex transport system ATP-binding protein